MLTLCVYADARSISQEHTHVQMDMGIFLAAGKLRRHLQMRKGACGWGLAKGDRWTPFKKKKRITILFKCGSLP